jgi:hypothetical protein
VTQDPVILELLTSHQMTGLMDHHVVHYGSVKAIAVLDPVAVENGHGYSVLGYHSLL